MAYSLPLVGSSNIASMVRQQLHIAHQLNADIT
jgi:hypothetical protein